MRMHTPRPVRRRVREVAALLGVVCAAALSVAPAVPALSDDAPPKPPVKNAPGQGDGASGGAAPGSVAIDRYFRGRVVKVEGRTVELAYDFAAADQLQDFEAALPFRAIRSITFVHKQGKVALSGTGSLRHKAVFAGPVSIAASLTPRKPRDFGFAVTEERESEVFTLYCLYDRYFGLGDGVHTPQNMIIKFIPRDPKVNKDGLQDWRYCGSRGQNPEIVSGRTYRAVAERDGIESRLRIDDWESKGREAGRDLTAHQVALYGYDAQFDADDLVVRGVLDAGWLAREKIDLASWKPPAAEPVAGAADPPAADDPAVARVRARIAAYPLETKPAAMAALLRDTTVPVAVRGEAAEKAKSVGSKQIVPFLVDGLYAADADARRLSGDVVKSLLGKNFGFRHDAPEEARKKAIQGLNDHIRKHPEEFR